MTRPRSTRRWRLPRRRPALVLLALGIAAGPAQARDWRGGPDRAGHSDGSTPLNHRVAWHAQVPGGVAAHPGPVVEAGLVVLGGMDGSVSAWTTEGHLAWRTPVGQPVLAPVTVDHEAVYAADGGGGVHALDRFTGEPQWSVKPGTARVTGAPALVDGVLYTTDWAGQVRALSAEDGGVLWSQRLRAPARAAVAARGDLLVVAGLDRTLRALDRATGAQRWEAPLGQRPEASPALNDRLAVVGDASGTLQAVSLDDGAVVWSRPLGAPILGGAALTETHAIVGTQDGRVVAVSLDRGAPTWEVTAGSRIAGSPTVNDELVLVGTSDGVLQALALEDGARLWQVGVEGPLEGAPVLRDGALFAATGRGLLTRVGEQAFVEVDVAEAEAVEQDAPMWVGHRLHTGGSRGVFVGRRDGAAWLLLSTLTRGLLESLDGGRTWQPALRWTPDDRPLAALPVHGDSLLVVGARGLRLQRGGRLIPLTKRLLLDDADTAARLVHGPDDTSLVWLGSGRAWLRVGLDAVELTLPAAARALAFAGGPDTLLAGCRDGNLYRSDDRGASWRLLSAPGAPVHELRVHSGNPRLVLALAESGPAGPAAVLRSTDGGASWTRLTDGLSQAWVGLAWDPRHPGVAWAATATGEVFRSTDQGQHFAPARLGLPEGLGVVGAALTADAVGVALALDFADGSTGVYQLGEVEERVRLDDVHFATGSAELGPNARSTLGSLLDRLQSDSSLLLRAEGHTDDVGDPDDNLVLSVRRAQAVSRLAAEAGVAAGRVQAFGYGEARPLVLDASAEARAQNRRVELYLIDLP